MKLSSARSLEGLKHVLKDPTSLGPDLFESEPEGSSLRVERPVYWVFSEVVDPEPVEGWANVTVIAPGKLGQEYPKTFGHYHPDDAPDEIYHLIEGEGVLILQKKYIDEVGQWQQDKVAEVVLIKARAGDEIVIKKEYGHSWSNIGDGPLISFDNWRSGHTTADYEVIEKMQGMAYYLIEEGGETKAIPNPNYTNLPEPKWVTAEEFLATKG